MAFGMSDDTDEEARRRLLRQGEDRLAGSPGAPNARWEGQPAPPYAAEPTVPMPAYTPPPYSPPPYTPPSYSVGPNALGPNALGPTALGPTARPVRKGQLVSWLAVLLGLAGALMIGAGIAAALGAIQFTDSPFAEASGWGSLVTFGLVVALVALLAAVIALFVARPKLVATLALVIALVAPWVGAIVGGKLGVDAFGRHASAALGGSADNLGELFTELLIMAGVDPEPYRQLIEMLFGG